MAISFLPVKILKGSPFKSVFFLLQRCHWPTKIIKDRNNTVAKLWYLNPTHFRLLYQHCGQMARKHTWQLHFHWFSYWTAAANPASNAGGWLTPGRQWLPMSHLPLNTIPEPFHCSTRSLQQSTYKDPRDHWTNIWLVEEEISSSSFRDSHDTRKNMHFDRGLCNPS